MRAIEIDSLTKDFRTGFWRRRIFRALDGLTLSVEEGETFGFLGPNGAGKTTTLKLLLRLIYPTAGSARIFGRPIDDIDVRAEVGYLPENPYFYDHLTGEEFLRYAAALCGLPGGEAQRRVGELLELVGLADCARLQLRKFSKGMLQRIGLAQAIINRPRLLFLDEPMSGLDPLGRKEMRDLLLDLKRSGATIFFSSHILSDVEALCDSVAILNRGRLIDCGSLGKVMRMEISAFEVIASGVDGSAAPELAALGRSERIGDRLKLEVSSDAEIERAVALIRRAGGRLISINPVRQTLEEFFVRRIES